MSMKRFKFSKPLIEGSTPPSGRNVIWVDVDENTEKVKSLKEFKAATGWQNTLIQDILPSNWNIIKISESKSNTLISKDLQLIDVYDSIDSDEVSYHEYIPSESLLSQIPEGNELTVFYLEEKITDLEKIKFIWIVSKEGRKSRNPKFITINYLRASYHKNNGDAVTGFDCIMESNILEYYYLNSSNPSPKWVSFSKQTNLPY